MELELNVTRTLIGQEHHLPPTGVSTNTLMNFLDTVTQIHQAATVIHGLMELDVSHFISYGIPLARSGTLLVLQIYMPREAQPLYAATLAFVQLI